MVVPLPNWPFFEVFSLTTRMDGLVWLSTVTSPNVRCLVALNANAAERVNSPHLRKLKKARQHAAQSIMLAWPGDLFSPNVRRERIAGVMRSLGFP